jgi:sulfur-oxidizing protein SoxX
MHFSRRYTDLDSGTANGRPAAWPLNPPAAIAATLLLLLIACAGPGRAADGEPYYDWSAENGAIAAPIGGKRGDAERGRELSFDRSEGNCIACHALPIAEAEFPGEIGPPLLGVGARLSEGQIRLRVVDAKLVNPNTIMPGYYRHPSHFNHVKKKYRGQTLLSAQDVEDLVAYLVTLK